MARPRSQDYDLVKRSIINSAASLFAKKGFVGTSIQEIAKAAGLTKAGVYHYFETKHEILRVMLADHLQVVHGLVQSALKEKSTPLSRFKTITRLLIECYTEPGSKEKHAVLMSDLDQLSPKDRQKIVATERKIVRAIGELLPIVHPPLKQHDAFSVPITMLYFGMINWIDSWYSGKGRLPPAELATLAAALFVNGLTHTDYSVIPLRGRRARGKA
jgi:AcrR family transcriptional regulator